MTAQACGNHNNTPENILLKISHAYLTAIEYQVTKKITLITSTFNDYFILENGERYSEKKHAK